MRIIFSLLALLFICNTSEAQIKIGLKLAPQLTWATSDNKNTTSNGSRLNAAYGIMIDYYFTPNYALGTEFCVSSYGANLNVKKDKYSYLVYNGNTYNAAPTGDIQIDNKLQYFQIPILLKMRTDESNSIRYYAEFGFGMGFLFKSKTDVTFGNQSISNVNVNSPDPSDEYRIYYDASHKFDNSVSSFRGSLIIGAGVHYSLKSNSAIVAGLRYDNGLSSFTSDDKLSTSLHFVALNFGLLF